MIKDLYLRELEREWAELEAEGVPTDKAYQLAGYRAWDATRDRLRERADMLRQRIKDEGK